LIGAFLLVYGLAAILTGWWAYSVTREAFAGVRNFTTAFERERTRALDTLQSVTGVLGGRTGSGDQPGGSIPQQAEGLAQRLRSVFGGPSATATPATRGGQGPSAESAGGFLDDLSNRLSEVSGSWGALGEGPFRTGMLDQVELAVNLVLIWMVLHGLLTLIFGLRLLLRNPTVVVTTGPPPAAWPVQPAAGYPPPPPTGAPPHYQGYPPQPPAGYPPQGGSRPDSPTRPG
jgi:hypothetical protein